MNNANLKERLQCLFKSAYNNFLVHLFYFYYALFNIKSYDINNETQGKN